MKKNPRCLVKNTAAIVTIETSRPICLELYKDVREFGRFMLRDSGVTIAAGLILNVSIFPVCKTNFFFLSNEINFIKIFIFRFCENILLPIGWSILNFSFYTSLFS